jgi:threonylcarbamoyladenosine tRNA methylthiotransferase MtaB
LGLYNHNGINLTVLLQQLIQLKGDFRIRLGSLEPNLVTQDILSLIESEEKICPHLHLPLQGSSDNLLKLMQRKYLLSDYLNILNRILNLKRKTTITTDLIIGHPGETKEDFDNLIDLLNQNLFLDVHLFAFSKRNITKAASLPNQVSETQKKERIQEAQKALRLSRQKKLSEFIGLEARLLVEKCQKSTSVGHTEHYILCQTKNTASINTFCPGKYQQVLASSQDSFQLSFC